MSAYLDTLPTTVWRRVWRATSGRGLVRVCGWFEGNMGEGGVRSFGWGGGGVARDNVSIKYLRNFIRQRKEHVQVGYSYAYSNVLLFYAFKIKNGELFKMNNCYYVCE